MDNNSSHKKSNDKSPDKLLLNQNTDRDLESEGGFNLDELPVDQFNNEHDKFNKVMSTNDHGGLLASIGLKDVNGKLLHGNEDDIDNYADDFDDDFADQADLNELADDKNKKSSGKGELSLDAVKNKADIFDTSGAKDYNKKN
mmetsp:Transcript_25579/g.18064  ORF Transcript_25579/g.18064 Transcript_25579/m.18064 type:complete len:143 (+) Transcript_25579:659-1087(+)|eukprot:CAMPEP_0116879240 /NCGR_PEP_ID=MMETSP0463-20121206/11040_1 /TAXON_ID=181622 /ORGANISM="Strombidinopsis sp, Strain SopsisLIS2011" /LENGTH=142 /DNA_ID=CAMNT_0004528363 /DNA_START=509 /DNA_END=937 /DNA_ORIENTATION=-